MMHYCPPNTTAWSSWHDHGISECFLDTVCMGSVAGLLAIFGLIEIVFYRRHSARLEDYNRPQSWLYRLQVGLTVWMSLLWPLRLLLQWLWLDSGQLAGFQLVVAGCGMFTWLLSLRLVLLERHRQLPTVPVRGHGLPLLLAWTLLLAGQAVQAINVRSPLWWFRISSTADYVEVVLYAVRLAGCLLLFLIGLKAPGIAWVDDYIPYQRDGSSVNNPRAGSTPPGAPLPGEAGFQAAEGSAWRNGLRKLRRLMPFIWPRRDPLLQLVVVVCMVLLIGTRLTNVYVPLYYKYIVDGLTETAGHPRPQFLWRDILIYVGLKFLQGGGVGSMGALNNMRSLLWIRVQQYTEREVQVDLFAHLHRLSLRWHLSRKTGEVLRVMDRGTSSINSLLSYLVFQILPTIADIVIAISFFAAAFNGWFGLIVFVTMLLYMAFTAIVTEWRTKYRRQSNLLDNAQRTKGVDSLLNYETVKYYDAEDYEIARYRTAILERQALDWKSLASLNMLNMIQNVVINGGLLAGSLLCAWLVSKDGSLTVGDYVLFSTYIIQLYAPLNWFGTYYRMIQQNFVDMENMLDLLKEPEEVIDLPGVPDLQVKQGRLEFRNVSFHYQPEKPILRGVSFSVEPGSTVALVGPSGGGKSTIIRLLFRFFDVTDGRIMLDNQDLKWVRQRSVRRAIGVVPQDTVLFNDTLRYNIKYARVGASDDDMVTAARDADMHDKIMSFPDGYETQVGERGLKLSGGEKQRVAIARTLLKAPQYILLDEATSALDTQTERNIQDSLARVSAGRTTLIVAHRLSTITHADQILVIRDGRITERGRHDELLEKGGVYHSMWRQQSETADRRARRSPDRRGAAAAGEAADDE